MNNIKFRRKKEKLFIFSNFLKTANIIILMGKKNHNLQNFISVGGGGRRKAKSFQCWIECLTLIKLFFTNNYVEWNERRNKWVENFRFPEFSISKIHFHWFYILLLRRNQMKLNWILENFPAESFSDWKSSTNVKFLSLQDGACKA